MDNTLIEFAVRELIASRDKSLDKEPLGIPWLVEQELKARVRRSSRPPGQSNLYALLRVFCAACVLVCSLAFYLSHARQNTARITANSDQGAPASVSHNTLSLRINQEELSALRSNQLALLDQKSEANAMRLELPIEVFLSLNSIAKIQ
jgi:hypothetical protein